MSNRLKTSAATLAQPSEKPEGFPGHAETGLDSFSESVRPRVPTIASSKSQSRSKTYDNKTVRFPVSRYSSSPLKRKRKKTTKKNIMKASTGKQ